MDRLEHNDRTELNHNRLMTNSDDTVYAHLHKLKLGVRHFYDHDALLVVRRDHIQSNGVIFDGARAPPVAVVRWTAEKVCRSPTTTLNDIFVRFLQS